MTDGEKHKQKRWPQDLFKHTSEGEREHLFYVKGTFVSLIYCFLSAKLMFQSVCGVIISESLHFERVGGLVAGGTCRQRFSCD